MATHIYTLEPASESGNKEILVKNQDAFNVTQWLERGVFRALEDQYLEQLTFAIFSSHPVTGADQLIETYDFKCTYPSLGSDGRVSKPKMNNQSLDKSALKTQANKFVRSLIEFSSTLEEIPENRWITLELAYTPNTPPDYQPEYFRDNTGNGLGFAAGANLLKIRVGSIKTDHHHLDVRFKGREHLDRETLSIFEDSTLLGSNGMGASRGDGFQLLSPGQPDISQDTLNEVDGHGRARSRSSSAFVARAPALASDTPRVSHVELSQSLSDMMVDRTLITRTSSQNKLTADNHQRGIDIELQHEIENTPPPSVNTSVARVRAYILEQGKSVIKDVSESLAVPPAEAREAFVKLTESGFLRRRGTKYTIHNRAAGEGLRVIPPAPRKTPSVRSSPTGSRSIGSGPFLPVVSRSRRRLPSKQLPTAEDFSVTMPVPPPTPVRPEEHDEDKLDFTYPTSTRTRSHTHTGQGYGEQKTVPPLDEDTMDAEQMSSCEAEWDSQLTQRHQRKKKKADSAPESGPGTDPQPELRAEIPALQSRPSPTCISSADVKNSRGQEVQTPYRHKRSRDVATPGCEAIGSTQPLSKRARKTSIVASPIVLRGADMSQHSQTVDGSQLECYAYTLSQPRSQ